MLAIENEPELAHTAVGKLHVEPDPPDELAGQRYREIEAAAIESAPRHVTSNI